MRTRHLVTNTLFRQVSSAGPWSHQLFLCHLRATCKLVSSRSTTKNHCTSALVRDNACTARRRYANGVTRHAISVVLAKPPGLAKPIRAWLFSACTLACTPLQANRARASSWEASPARACRPSSHPIAHRWFFLGCSEAWHGLSASPLSSAAPPGSDSVANTLVPWLAVCVAWHTYDCDFRFG